jgi:dTDP-glucose 4,6-dehydratase
VYSYWRTYGLPAVIIRPFNQFGPFQHLEKCIPRFITSAMEGADLTLHGDGTAARDWCFVEDTCQALLAALEVPLDAVMGEVINLGTGVATNVRTVASMILEQSGGTSRMRQIDNRPGQVDLHISSTDKAERLLRWRARTDLETGIAHTIDWYRRNESWWRKLEWMKHVPITVSEGRKVLH